MLDTIFRAVEKHGLTVKSEHRGTFYFEYKTEKISCRLREKNKQVRRPKTADEMRWSFAGDKNWTQVLLSARWSAIRPRIHPVLGRISFRDNSGTALSAAPVCSLFVRLLQPGKPAKVPENRPLRA
jgi:hypothetical protein